MDKKRTQEAVVAMGAIVHRMAENATREKEQCPFCYEVPGYAHYSVDHKQDCPVEVINAYISDCNCEDIEEA